MKILVYCIMFLTTLTGCGSGEKGERIPPVTPFDDDVAFLKKHSQVIELKDPEGKSRIAVMPALQARVMTSTAGDASYGWINRKFFEAGDTSKHMNAFGGEERIWLGPEGGQFSIFFPPDSAFTFDNWHTPEVIDLESWDVAAQTEQSASFVKAATLTNYSGTVLNVRIHREIRVLSRDEARQTLGIDPDSTITYVAYQTDNRLENAGAEPWSKQTGLLSIWLLGMFNPSPEVCMIIPFEPGLPQRLGPVVNDEYFGKVPSDRLKVSDSVLFFRGDGLYRSKIGLSPERAKGVMASYDGASRTLTIVTYTKGGPDDVYVNSKWELQREPYSGDVVNAYNDGPPSPGAAPMGPFYELESSSPARELNPGESVRHVQTTLHIQGEEKSLDAIMRKVLGVSIDQVKSAF